MPTPTSRGASVTTDAGGRAPGVPTSTRPGAPGRAGAPAPVATRWPAEWERQASVWLAWPRNPTTWPGRIEAVEAAYVEMVRALQGRELVRIAAADVAHEERARGCLRAGGIDPDEGIDFAAIATDDAWLRDCGPIVVWHGTQRLALDFRFDAWGGKYPPWDRDDAFAAAAARHMGIPCVRCDEVLEGGAIDGDGEGSVLTTEACLLHPNRGGRTRERAEALLADRLGARAVLWLGDGIAGDDTDGHVDDVARFIAPGEVVVAIEADPADENHAPLADNRERLRRLRDARGKPLALVEVPMPPPVRAHGARLPASYVNFLLANEVALVPVFDVESDARALATLRECLVGREVVPISARDLVRGLGAVHCLTQQEPAAPAARTPPARGIA